MGDGPGPASAHRVGHRHTHGRSVGQFVFFQIGQEFSNPELSRARRAAARKAGQIAACNPSSFIRAFIRGDM